jgi:DNA repair exonuclease SbcCD ATPase subunit
VTALLSAGDPAELRQEEKALKVEEEAVAIQVRGTKKLLQENELEAERLGRELAEEQKTLGNLDSQVRVEDANRAAYRDAIDRAGKLLPEAWRAAAAKAGLAEQNQWKVELDELTRRGTEAKYQELAKTRASVEAMKQDIALAEQEAAGFPEDARRPAEEIRAQLAAAKRDSAAREEDVQKAREEKAILDRHRQERDRLRAKTRELERELNYATPLAQLLGRDRLQRHLVRTAERQIVDYANGILDRLSGGQLFLRLCGGDDGIATERALELEAYNRQTGDAPINVAFLSGSQRFRVAVSLALGIGQYASRQHRPIESVIIDEGFGCLDRNGRQGMIQELHNLRGHLQCILLVSHQEEFAEAFPDGYRFELAEGATKVTRFQR